MTFAHIVLTYATMTRISEGEAEDYILAVQQRVLSARRAGALWVYCDKIVKDMIGIPELDAIALVNAEG